MNIQTIHTEIEELLSLVKEWEQSGTIPSIERDVVLSKLSRLYEAIRFDSAPEVETSQENKLFEVVEPVEVASVSEVLIAVEESIVDDSIFELDIEGLSLVEESEEELEPETVVETETEPEPEPEPEIETQPEPVSKPVDNTLFDINIIPKQSRKRRSVIMSLYEAPAEPVRNEPIESSNEPIEQVKEEELKEAEQQELKIEEQIEVEKPQEQPTITSEIVVPTEPVVAETPVQHIMEETPVQHIVGESISSVETVADRFAVNSEPTLSDSVVYSSFSQLGINEQCQIARELFDDDIAQCREVISKIDTFDSYDDAMIYIAENFAWSDSSQSVKLILSILDNKFEI